MPFIPDEPSTGRFVPDSAESDIAAPVEQYPDQVSRYAARQPDPAPVAAPQPVASIPDDGMGTPVAGMPDAETNQYPDQVSRSMAGRHANEDAVTQYVKSGKQAVQRAGSGILDALWGAAQSAETRDKLPDGDIGKYAVTPYQQFKNDFQDVARQLMPKDKAGMVQRLDSARQLEKYADDNATSLVEMKTSEVNSSNVAPWLVANAVNQSPSFVGALVSYLVPPLAPFVLPLIGASAGGNQYAENIKAGVAQGASADDAFFNGNTEVGTEIAGMLGMHVGGKVLKAVMSAVPESVRSAAASSILARFLGTLGGAGAGALVEGTGEGVGQFMQDVHQEAVTGRDAGDIWENVKKAFITSLLPGGVHGTVGAGTQLVQDIGASNETAAAQAVADQTAAASIAKAQGLASGTMPGKGISSTRPIEEPAGARDESGIDPLTLKPYGREEPLALPPPAQVPIQVGEAMAPTEQPVVTPGEQHANEVYGKRFDEEALQALLPVQQKAASPSEIAIPESGDTKATIDAILAAPMTEVAPALSAPESVNPEVHAAASGDLAGIMLSIQHLTAQAKVTPPKQRQAVLDQISGLKQQAWDSIKGYGAQFGQDAADHMHRVAAETFHTMKGDYRGLVRPTAPVQESAPFTEREQPAAVNTEVSGAQPVEVAGEQQPQAPVVAASPAASLPAAAPADLKITPGTVDEHAHAAATSPTNDLTITPKQAAAGNYPKGHFTFTSNGMGVTIENPSGSVREDIHNMPPKWRSRMTGYHYGYLKLTDAADSAPGSKYAPILQKGKQGLDVLVKQGIGKDYNGPVFVIDQKSKGGAFDEHKIVIGPQTEAEARAGYSAQYPKGWDGIQSISQTTMAGLKQWARFGDTKAPYADKVLTGEDDKVNLTEAAEQSFEAELKPLESKQQQTVYDAIKVGPQMTGVATLHAKARHLLLGKIEQIFRDKFAGVRELTGPEQRVIGSAVQDLINAGMNPDVFAGLGAIAVYKGEPGENGHHSIQTGDVRGVHVTESMMSAAMGGSKRALQRLRQVLAHEFWHQLDTLYVPGKLYGPKAKLVTGSSISDRTALRVDGWGNVLTEGDIAKEMNAAYGRGGPVTEFLSYPLGPAHVEAHIRWLVQEKGKTEAEAKVIAADVVREEILAQAWSLLYTNPALLKSEMPKTYALLKEVESATNKAAAAGQDIQGFQSAASAAIQGGAGAEGTGRVGGDRLSRSAEDPGVSGPGVRGPPAKVKPKPDLTRRGATLTKEERARLTAKTADNFVALYDALPSSNETAAIAWAGRAKRGWYRKAALSTHTVFGSDAPRFTALLAGLSPRTSVEFNLQAALQTWAAWDKAGRPQAHDEIVRALQVGIRGTAVLIGTARLNAIRALTHPNPSELVLSGPKVNSFFANLMGHVNEVTNDGWMAAWAGVDANIFKGTLPRPDAYGQVSGKGAGYLAANAHAREAAKILTKLTGEHWTASEVQETVWSWAKTLYERANVQTSARDIINDRNLTHDLIAATPDFGTLLQGGVYGQTLRQAGYGDALDALAESSRESAAEIEHTSERGGAAEAAPFAPETQLRYERASADRLAKLRELRDAESKARIENRGDAYEGDLTEEEDSALDEKISFNKSGEHVVNIGLDTNDGQGITVEEAVKALEATGVKVTRQSHVQSASEPTLVATLDRALTPEEAHQVSVDLKQEAIAQRSNGEGELYGPQADKWKPWTPEYFRDHPEGKTSRSATTDRGSVTESIELKGDGRGFTDFFTAASKGERAPDVKTYKPVLDISSISDFSEEYVKHRGNFDDHIATSIPGFREVQQAVGAAIVRAYPVPGKSSSATLLDIAASEGAFNKTITELSDGAIFTLALDPNLQMAKFFEEHSQVPGADYDVSAFGSKEEEGKLAWKEGDTPIRFFKPIEKYDIVHEAMGFQFISNARNAQFARVKELMKPDGIALFEEKVKEDTPQWLSNEAKKDSYKARYFTKAQMQAKAAEVLEKGKDGAAAAEAEREQSTVGMNDLMTTGHELETALTNNWTYVAQYWDSGNFKGYVASDSLSALESFTGNLVDLNSEYSTVATPRMVSEAKPDTSTMVKVMAIEEETGRNVEVQVAAQDALDSIDYDIEKSKQLLECLNS